MRTPRVLIVKQSTDPFGPWASLRFDDQTPLELVEKFVLRPTLWEMTCFLHADWAIIPQTEESPFSNYIKRNTELMALMREHQTSVLDPKDITWNDYEVVISLEPCVPRSVLLAHPQPLFLYLLNEHTNCTFHYHLRHPQEDYTAFLDHMCTRFMGGNPHARCIDVPYLRDPKTVRACFPVQAGDQKPVVWVEARTVLKAAGASTWGRSCEELIQRLEEQYGLSLRFKENNFRKDAHAPATPDQKDSVAYYRQLTKAQYFVALTAAGAGQALADAASAGLICFGSRELPYHRMICHPDHFSGSLDEALQSVLKIHGQNTARSEALRRQDAGLAAWMQARFGEELSGLRNSDVSAVMLEGGDSCGEVSASGTTHGLWRHDAELNLSLLLRINPASGGLSVCQSGDNQSPVWEPVNNCLVYLPNTAEDHLATNFVQLRPSSTTKARWAVLRLALPSAPSSLPLVSIMVQNQDFHFLNADVLLEEPGAKIFRIWFFEDTTALRILFTGPTGSRCLLPEECLLAQVLETAP